MRYVFGAVALRLCGSEAMLAKLAGAWRKYQDNATPAACEVTVCLADEYLPDEPCGGDGWVSHAADGVQTACYVEQGRPVFALRYSAAEEAVTVQVRSAVGKNVQLGVMYAMLLALHGRCIGLHGVTVICGDKAIILSAASGTGKTTLGKLLEKHCESVIINGDFALLSVSDEHGAVFEPTPICGTSGTCHNYRLPISHIVFLEQAKETTIRPLPARQALVRLVSNAFVPQWDAEIRSSLEAFALQLLAKTPVSVMAFPPTQEAAQALADYLQS